jgi:hypothetical protein
MSKKNTILDYALLLILSTTKEYSFEALGRLIRKSGDTIARLLRPASKNFDLMQKIAIYFFKDTKNLTLSLDDTLIRKISSQWMEGSGWFFDTKVGRRIIAYKLLLATISDGQYTFPIMASLLFAPELVLPEDRVSKEELVQSMILAILKLFPDKKIIITVDGAFATKVFLTWCIENKLHAEVRMHSNRVVTYKGQRIAIRDIKTLRPKGRQMARTIKATWHDLDLDITAERRIDKHGNETVVFQAATYQTKPSEHVKAYKRRWPIEKVIRTCKQKLGLGNCFSTKLDTQFNHIASVLLAYCLVQIERKKRNLEKPEDALKAIERKNINKLRRLFLSMDQIFGDVHA